MKGLFLTLTILFLLARIICIAACAVWFFQAWGAKDLPDMIGFGLITTILMVGR
jgi:hypothetical protein